MWTTDQRPFLVLRLHLRTEFDIFSGNILYDLRLPLVRDVEREGLSLLIPRGLFMLEIFPEGDSGGVLENICVFSLVGQTF